MITLWEIQFTFSRSICACVCIEFAWLWVWWWRYIELIRIELNGFRLLRVVLAHIAQHGPQFQCIWSRKSAGFHICFSQHMNRPCGYETVKNLDAQKSSTRYCSQSVCNAFCTTNFNNSQIFIHNTCSPLKKCLFAFWKIIFHWDIPQFLQAYSGKKNKKTKSKYPKCHPNHLRLRRVL